MPGELELIPATAVFKRPIIVKEGVRGIDLKYGMNFRSDPIYLKFTSVREDVGHSECLPISRGIFQIIKFLDFQHVRLFTAKEKGKRKLLIS
ncbi:hypothetical protein PoB_003139800 [Plakobranchus ocellatus]|uniref:Uncharacterized protein n=1 Tax=Plakobranchus ocellatus TaxID=259542 RepID=A0AAV4ADM2_9GAST|nr:hypothetical protein PoB_003139800 [Plakobranchus ocellatus]